MGRVLDTFRLRAIWCAAATLAASTYVVAPSHSTPPTAVDLAGRPVDPLNAKASSGKIVVLVFVRTDCPVVNRYAPTIQRVSEAHADKVVFWLVYPSKSESAVMVRKHERAYEYKIAALRDPQHELVKEAQAQITPEVAVFDTSHKLIYHGRIDDRYVDLGRSRNAPTTHELEDAIEAAISGRTLAVNAAPAVGCYISDLE